MTAKSTSMAALTQLIQADDAGVTLAIKVVPNASRNKVAALLGDRLKVAVAAPPEDGKANDAVCQLLAKVLGVPARNVVVIAGHTQPLKRVSVHGVDVQQAAASLSAVMR